MTDDYLADRLPEKLPSDPMHWAEAWLNKATKLQYRRNPNSVALVTVGADKVPSARIVLCKTFEADPGYVVIYTNYLSRKCQEIDNNANVSLLFHWDSIGRQIRIDGIAVRSPAEESDAYFATRDPSSQLGAWGSDQSQPIASRVALIAQVRNRAAELGIVMANDTDTSVAPGSAAVPRPPHWGGIRIWASSIELWLDGKDRIHDRALWKRNISPESAGEFSTTAWVGTRLQP